MNVFVMGHRGMLGQAVARFLRDQGVIVHTSELRYTGKSNDSLIRVIADSTTPWVINCVAALPVSGAPPEDMIRVNSLLPAHLKSQLRQDQIIVQPSTDAVFPRLGANRASFDPPCPDDDYGFTKMLGEAPAEVGRFYVLRTSIIGFNSGRPGRGLLEWVTRSSGSVDGYANHAWNGVTVLEWARHCYKLIESGASSSRPVTQLGFLPAISKFELISMANQIWNLELCVRSRVADNEVTRSLVPDVPSPGIREQLVALRDWHACSTVSDTASCR